jgi:uroporphyrinogen-III synthase
MRLLVTRPEPDGERTAAQLRARGCEVMLAPLMRVEPMAADLDGAWHALALTSVNAVRAVAAHPKLDSLRAIPAYAVGGRTADTALALGFDNVISAEGDARDLARVLKIHFQAGARVLYLAGEDRAGDLGGELAAAGLRVATAVIYRAAAAAAFPAPVRDEITAGRIDGVLHFSRRSAATYLACAAAAGIRDKARAPSHYCLSWQVAEPLKDAGATKLHIAERPTEPDLLALIPV